MSRSKNTLLFQIVQSEKKIATQQIAINNL
jgi:hypothetical protein